MIKRSSSKRKTTNGSLSPSSPSAQQHNISHSSSYDVSYLELIETLKRSSGQAVPKDCFSRIMRAMKQAKCCNDQTANFSQEQIEDFYQQIISQMTVKSFEQPQIVDLQSTKQLFVVLAGEATLYQPNSVTENDDNHDKAMILSTDTFTSQIQQLQQEDSPFHQSQLQSRVKDTPTGKGSSQFALQGHTLLKRLNQYSVFGDSQQTSEISPVNYVARVTSDTILSCVSHRSIEQLLLTNIREMYLRVELLEKYIPSVSTKSIMALSKQLTLVVLSRGQVIYSEGDPGSNIYFIKEGEVTFYKKIHNNKDNQGNINPKQQQEQQGAQQNQLSNADNDQDPKRSQQQLDSSVIPASDGGSASAAASLLLRRRRKKGSLEVSLSEINKGQMFGQDEVLLKQKRQKTAKATSTGVELYVLEAQHLFAFLEKLDQSSGEGKHVFQSLLDVSAHKEAFYSEMVSKVQRVEDKQIGQTMQIRNILDRQNKVRLQIQQSQAQEDREKDTEEICDLEGGASQNREFEKELTKNQSSIQEIGQQIENNRKFMNSASNKQFMVDNGSNSNTMRASNSTYVKDSSNNDKVLNNTESGKKKRLKVDFGNPLFEELAANNSERIKKIHHNYNNSNLSSSSTIPHTRPTQNLIEALLKLSQNGIINSSLQGNTKVVVAGNNSNNRDDDNSSTPVENATQHKINSNGMISNSNNCINDGSNITSMGLINTITNGNTNQIASVSKRNSISISISGIASNNISHRNSVVLQEASRRSSMICNLNLDGSQSMSIAAMPTSIYSPSSLSCCTTPKAQLVQQQQLQYLMLARKKSKFQQLSQRGKIQQQENSISSNTSCAAEKQPKAKTESRETDFVPEQTEQTEKEDTHSGRNALLIPQFQRCLSAQISSRNSQHRNSMRLFTNGAATGTATMSDDQQQSPMQHFSSCQSPTASNTPPRMNHLLLHSRTINRQTTNNNNNSNTDYNNNLSNASPKSYSNSNATPKSNCCHHSSSFLVGNQQTQQKQLVNSPSSQSDQSPQQGSSQQKGYRPQAISGFKELANQVLSETEEDKSMSTKLLNEQNQGCNTPASLCRITEKHTSQAPQQQLLHGVIQTRKISSASRPPFLNNSIQKGCSETESLKQAGDLSGCMKTSSWFAAVSKQQPRTTTSAGAGSTPLNNYLNLAYSQESLIHFQGGSQTDCLHSPLCSKDSQNNNSNYHFSNRNGMTSPVSPSGVLDYQLINSKNTNYSCQKSYEMLSPFQRPTSSYCSPSQPTKVTTTMRCAKEINSSSSNICNNNQNSIQIQIGSQTSSSLLKSPKSNSLFNTARRCSLKYPQSSQLHQYQQQQFHSSSLITPMQTPSTNQRNSDYNNNNSSSKVVLTEPFTICKRGSNSTLKLFKYSNASYSSATKLQYYMPQQCHVQDFQQPLGIQPQQYVAQGRSDKQSDYQSPGAATPNESEFIRNKSYITNQSNLMTSRKADTFNSAVMMDRNTIDNNNNNNMNVNGHSTEVAATTPTPTLMDSSSPKQQLLKLSFNFRRLSKPSLGSHNHNNQSTNKPNGQSANGLKSTKTNKSHSQFMTQPDGGDTSDSNNQFLSSKSMKTQPSEQEHIHTNQQKTQETPKENRCCQVKVFPVDSPGVKSGQTKDSSAQQQRLFKQLTSIFPTKLTQTNRADSSNRNMEQQNQSSSEQSKQTKNIHISQRKAATVILSQSALGGGASGVGFFSKVCSPLKTPTKANLQCRQVTRGILPSRNLKERK